MREYLFILLVLVISIIYPYSIEFRETVNITELKLLERDYLIFEDQKLCFDYSYDDNISIYLNNIFLFNTNNKSVCLENIPEGESEIKLSSSEKFVSFNFIKMNQTCKESKESDIFLQIPETAEQYEIFDVNISFTNDVCKGRIYFLKLFENGKLAKIIPIKTSPLETKTFSETMRITNQGLRKIRVETTDKSAEKEIFVKEQSLHAPIGLVLFSLLAFVLFRKGFNLESLSLLFGSSLAFLVIIPFTFDKLGMEIFFPTLLVSTALVVILCLKM